MQNAKHSGISPWERTRFLVDALLHPHPLLGDAPDSLVVEASANSLRATSGPVVAEVHGHEWWIPLSEERARRLALDLALQVREQLDRAA